MEYKIYNVIMALILIGLAIGWCWPLVTEGKHIGALFVCFVLNCLWHVLKYEND